MKPKVFIDTNVILDVYQEREGYEPSARILQMMDDGIFSVAVSFLSIANITYILRKNAIAARMALVPSIYQLSQVMEVLPMDNVQLQEAIMLDGPDFEDILQYVCALHGGCDIIVTRNVRHFLLKKGVADSIKPIPIMSPAEFVSWIEKS